MSRTVGQHQVVDELIVSFTHDREMRVYLPGVVPTGRKVVLPHVVVMGFGEGGRVAHEHIYWDQASLLCRLDYLIRHYCPFQAPTKPSGCWIPTSQPMR